MDEDDVSYLENDILQPCHHFTDGEMMVDNNAARNNLFQVNKTPQFHLAKKVGGIINCLLFWYFLIT